MNTYEEFRDVMREERENLTRLSDFWNTQVKCDKTISKDTQGRIRAAVGKTRLLLAEKFKQFEGLVDQSENHTSEKEISINDLQGFWDLVLIQVNEVKDMFRELDPFFEKTSGEVRKCLKTNNRELEFSKEIGKAEGRQNVISKKKLSSDHLEQTEKRIKEITEKEKGKLDSRDLKNKVSLSKL